MSAPTLVSSFHPASKNSFQALIWGNHIHLTCFTSSVDHCAVLSVRKLMSLTHHRVWFYCCLGCERNTQAFRSISAKCGSSHSSFLTVWQGTFSSSSFTFFTFVFLNFLFLVSSTHLIFIYFNNLCLSCGAFMPLLI
jgi:hypothetical protein